MVITGIFHLGPRSAAARVMEDCTGVLVARFTFLGRLTQFPHHLRSQCLGGNLKGPSLPQGHVNAMFWGPSFECVEADILWQARSLFGVLRNLAVCVERMNARRCGVRLAEWLVSFPVL